MHYHVDMITHDTAFGAPVDGTGGSKLVSPKQEEWRIDEPPTY